MTLSELSQQIALYENPDHTIRLEVRTDEDAVWLTQQQMAQLYYGQSDLFGRERGGLFEGIINTLYQGFGDQDLHPSVETKAANLLYLVVKDRPFLDGNKRSAAALFVYFLDKNGLLKHGGRLLVKGNALAAMTLMIALSDPSEKDAMVALVENFIA